MADRHPAYIECSRVKRMKPLQRNSLFPPKDQERERRELITHRPLFLLPLSQSLSIHIPAPKAGGGPGLARVHSFPGIAARRHASPPPRRRGYLYPSARPRHSSSQAKQSTRSTAPSSAPAPARDQQDQHVLLRRQLRVRLRLQVQRRMQRVGI
jgi:hypothetical protein